MRCHFCDRPLFVFEQAEMVCHWCRKSAALRWAWVRYLGVMANTGLWYLKTPITINIVKVNRLT